MRKGKFSVPDRLKSFKYAFNGIRWLLIHEHNARLHLFAVVLVCLAGYFFKISTIEWLLILICIGMVIAAELFNTVAEQIADFVSTGKHQKIKIIKDLAAAGVLVTAITAFIAGAVIFIPKFCALIN